MDNVKGNPGLRTDARVMDPGGRRDGARMIGRPRAESTRGAVGGTSILVGQHRRRRLMAPTDWVAVVEQAWARRC